MNDPSGNKTISGHDAQSRNFSPILSVFSISPISHETKNTNPSPIMPAETTAFLSIAAAKSLRNTVYTPFTPPLISSVV